MIDENLGYIYNDSDVVCTTKELIDLLVPALMEYKTNHFTKEQLIETFRLEIKSILEEKEKG